MRTVLILMLMASSCLADDFRGMMYEQNRILGEIADNGREANMRERSRIMEERADRAQRETDETIQALIDYSASRRDRPVYRQQNSCLTEAQIRQIWNNLINESCKQGEKGYETYKFLCQ